MSKVIPRGFRVPRRMVPGLFAPAVSDNNSQPATKNNLSPRHAASKKFDNKSFRKKSTIHRSKSPFRKRESPSQATKWDRVDQSYNYNVPAIYRRPNEGVDEQNSTNLIEQQSATTDRQRQLAIVRKECHSMLLDYRQRLYRDSFSFPSLEDDFEKNSTHMLVEALGFQRRQRQTTLQNLRDTEEQFKHICIILQSLARVTGISNGADSEAAEASLRSLIQLRVDRTAMVGEASRDPDEREKDWGKWISSVFVVSPDQNNAEGTALTAHSDANYGPNVALFGRVLAGIANEAIKKCESSHIGSREQQQIYLAAASRMIQLIELMSSTGFEITSHIMCQVLQVYQNCGSMVAARKAEQFYNDHGKNVPTWHVAKAALRVYRAAGKDRDSLNSYAALAGMVSDLATNTEMKTAESYSQRLSFFSHALQCLQVPMTVEMPAEQCLLADAMVKKCVGKKDYRGFFHLDQIRPEPKYATLVHNLLSVYAMSRDDSRLEQAKVLLTYLEKTLEMFGSQTYMPVQPPFLDTYIAMLVGIQRSCLSEDSVVSGKVNTEWTTYAITLLDRMIEQGLWPNNDVFDLLFRICIRDDSPSVGEKTETILRRMELRQVFDSDLIVTANHYKEVILAWGLSAKRAFPGAAERADQLLQKMEIRSGVSSGHVFPEVMDGEEVQHPDTSMYNRRLIPDAATYSAFLRCCTMVRVDDEKERAMSMIIDVLGRMEAFGIEPSDDVFKFALWSCKNLLKDPARQVIEGTKVFDLAQKKAKVSRELVKTFRELTDNQKKAGSHSKTQGTFSRLDGDSAIRYESLPLLPPLLVNFGSEKGDMPTNKNDEEAQILEKLPLLPPIN
jgi:hypothetical protein